MREDAIRRLEACFSTSIFGFYNKWTQLTNTAEWDKDPFQCDIIEVNHADCVVVINLARVYNVPQILPAAFYVCAQMDLQALSADDPRDYDITGDTRSLSKEDVIRCSKGQEKLRAMALKQVVFVIELAISPGCQGRGCSGRLQDTRSKILSNNTILTNTRPLATSWWINELHLCSHCQSHFELAHDKLRQETWSNLPSWFGLI